MDSRLINVNGEIVRAAQAKVSALDRGFLYGDSLYEVCRTYGGKVFRVDEHLRRLEESARLARFTLGQPLSKYREEMERTLDAFREQAGTREAYLRLIVTRGIGRIGFALTCLESPTQYLVIAQPLDEPSADDVARGLSLRVATRYRVDRRALDPAMKSGNYLNSLLAYLEVASEGGEDAILCNSAGEVTEGTTFNVFYARRGIVATPPLDVGILDGITRRHVIACARELGIECREVRFPRERLDEADEIFATSTIKEVMAVTRLDGRPVGGDKPGGKPGPIAQRLRDRFREKALQECR